MKERPILFNGAMVRAILAGEKTQTRRLVKPQPYIDRMGNFCWNGSNFGQGIDGRPLIQSIASPIPCSKTKRVHCPFGKPGDRLWVRESFADLRGTGIEHRPDPSGPLQRYAFAAESPPGSASDEARKDFGVKWKPSIHMPRNACRILMEIVSVRVECLQDISEADALAEGITYHQLPVNPQDSERARTWFRGLWSTINGFESWPANPWVWVVEFRRVQQ